MKFALCLSGHLRTFTSVLQYLKQNVIDPLSCDIFIHTWDVIGAPTNKTPGDNTHLNVKTIEHLPNVYAQCNPKGIFVENEGGFQHFINSSNDIVVPPHEQQYIMTHIGYHVSMFYSIYMANQLKIEYEKSHNFVYDRVIRCRPDIRFGTIFEKSMFTDPNFIYLPKIATYCTECVNDQLAIGSSDIIDKYSNIYENIISYYRNHVATARPEALIKYHLDKNNIAIKKIDIEYDIYRLDGGILRQYEMKGEMLSDKWK